jgi:hypothetical protein
MSGADAPAGRAARNLDILEALLTIEAEWGGHAPDADDVTKLALMRSLRYSVPDAVIAERLWEKVRLLDGKLREGMGFLDYAVDAITTPSRAARRRGTPNRRVTRREW